MPNKKSCTACLFYAIWIYIRKSEALNRKFMCWCRSLMKFGFMGSKNISCFVSVIRMVGFTISLCISVTWQKLHISCNLMEIVGSGAILTFVYLICSIIAKDVEASSAAVAPSRGWCYVDRVTHLFEFVILAKNLRKQHAMSWDTDTKIEPGKVNLFPCAFYQICFSSKELWFDWYLIHLKVASPAWLKINLIVSIGHNCFCIMQPSQPEHIRALVHSRAAGLSSATFVLLFWVLYEMYIHAV